MSRDVCYRVAMVVALTVLPLTVVNAQRRHAQPDTSPRILDSWIQTVGGGSEAHQLRIRKIRTTPPGRIEYSLSTIDQAKRWTAFDPSSAVYSKVDPAISKWFADRSARNLARPAKQLVVVWIHDRNRLQETRRPPEFETEISVDGPEVDLELARPLLLAQQLADLALHRQKVRDHIMAVITAFLPAAQIPPGDIYYQCRYAPAIVVWATAADVERLRNLDGVQRVMRPSVLTPELDETTASARADRVWLTGFAGTDVPIAVVNEKTRIGRADWIDVVKTRFPGAFAMDHAARVASIIASKHDPYRGYAYECALMSAGSHGEPTMMPACEWALDEGAVILNCSQGDSSAPDEGLQSSDIFVDQLIHGSRVALFKSAGNCGGDVVTPPGRGYNCVTVGNVNGNRSYKWTDDTTAIKSSWGDPTTGTDKPELAAFGSPIYALSATTEGSIGSATSWAAPAATGIAGLCVSRTPTLADEPATLKAKLLVSGLPHFRQFGVTDPLDAKIGAGVALASAVWSGSYSVSIESSDFDSSNRFELPVSIPLKAGDPKRIVLAYCHPTDASPGTATYTDLDLELYEAGTMIKDSTFGFRNPFEVIDITPAADGTATVKIHAAHWDSGLMRVGIAFASLSTLDRED